MTPTEWKAAVPESERDKAFFSKSVKQRPLIFYINIYMQAVNGLSIMSNRATDLLKKFNIIRRALWLLLISLN